MNIILLKDREEDVVDTVIISMASTGQEVHDAITRAKENEDYQWEDLIKALPEDCRVYDAGFFEEVYY